MKTHYVIWRRPHGSHCWTTEGTPHTDKDYALAHVLVLESKYPYNDIIASPVDLPKEPDNCGSQIAFGIWKGDSK